MNLNRTFSVGDDHTVVCGDVLEQLSKIPDNTFDVIVTSPPYNLLNSSGNGMKDGRGGKWANAKLTEGYESHRDDMPREEYISWMREVISECFRVLKPTGALFFNHKYRVQNGLIEDHQEMLKGFNVRQIIIWRRNGGINFNPTYFLPTYEVVYLMPKTAKGKDSFRLKKGANAFGDVWDIGQEMNNEHPAPFPVELVERILSSCEGSMVLDPFTGSGTTQVAAKKLGWSSMGIDCSPEYVSMAVKRLKDTKDNINLEAWF